ncbi:MAG: mechanosensitive ion channel family protein [Candidatus Omnitrophica bacterium]|nr:mechanosensitive ion channel family protein [Candidatus Omnitrophota bacterium]MBU4478648.1 mechanosensitive ion channel family protein [Candidatus Omnitrophota bacterium]
MYKVYFGNSILDYFICAGIFIVSVAALNLFSKIVLSRLKLLAAKTKTSIDDFMVRILQRNIMPLLYFGALYLSIQNLTLHPAVNKVIEVAGVVILTVIVIRFLVSLINFLLLSFWLKEEKDGARERSLKGVVNVIKIIIWGVGVIFLLDNLGFKVSSVIAGLGIGGIAVALAAQVVLGDLFSFFAILFDRPFEIGDFIIVGDYLGTVEYVGIKTTRIRSLGGEQLIFSNTDLTNSRVRNYKRMEKRRVVFKLGVVYGTSHEQLQVIPKIIKDIIEHTKDTAFDRAHFSAYGDFNLVVEVVYYVLSPDYNKYMDIQQEINLAIKKEFEKKGIEFAFPTQTIYVNK